MRRLATFAVLLLGCSGPSANDARLAPVFAILCADVDPGMEPHPCCTGFAMGGQVVTANHCVPNDDAMLVTHDQWVNTASAWEPGHITARDEALDIAWIDAKIGAQLQHGGSIGIGDHVSALMVESVSSGAVTGSSGNYWTSDVDSKLGDSGSAIVDQSGYAVGVLTRCLVPDGEKQCSPHTAIFSELPQ